jgi:hypothetical protein
MFEAPRRRRCIVVERISKLHSADRQRRAATDSWVSIAASLGLICAEMVRTKLMERSENPHG